MSYANVTEDILEIFAEGAALAPTLLHPRPPEERKDYKRIKAKEYELRDIRTALVAGERPKRWGKRWRSIAQSLGIVCS